MVRKRQNKEEIQLFRDAEPRKTAITTTVGPQTFPNYLQKENVVPELYKLAYDRYQSQRDRQYKTYPSWSPQAALQKSETAMKVTTASKDNNRNVSEGNIKAMERVLGLQENGIWTGEDQKAAGGLSKNNAWMDYQRGRLQNYKSVGLGDMGLSNGNVRTMERVLGLTEDGYWSEEDKNAAGGLSESIAWEAYQRGFLQNYKSRGLGEKNIKPSEGTQAQLEHELNRRNSAIAQMENMLTVYWDLTTREIGRKEELKLDRLRQQYSSPYELKDAIEEAKKKTKVLEKELSVVRKRDQEAAWEKKYSGMTYTELQAAIEGLEDGTEKDWVTAYAPNTMTQLDYTMTVQKTKNELATAIALQDEDKNLKKRLQVIEPRSEEAQRIITRRAEIYSQFGDLDDCIARLKADVWYLEKEAKYKFLYKNQDYAELSQFQENGSPFYKMINKLATTGEGEEASISKYMGSLFGPVSIVKDALNIDNLRHMEKDELAIYNYVYATEGEDAATEYLEYLNYILNERAMGKAMEWVSQKTQAIPVLSQTTASVLSTPLGSMGGLGMLDVAEQKIRNAITGEYKPIDYNRKAMFAPKASSKIRDTVADDIVNAIEAIDIDKEKYPILSQVLNGENLAEIYRLGMDMQDSAYVFALSKLNPVLGMASSGLQTASAGTQAMLDAKQKGATDEQALNAGINRGLIEMLIEEYGEGDILEMDDWIREEICNQILNKVLEDIFSEFEYSKE